VSSSVVEDEIELSASGPLCEPVRETPVERIRENAQRAKCWLDFVQILNLVVKIAFLCGRQFQGRRSLDENFDKQREEVEVLLGRWNRERIDLEAWRVQSHAGIRAAKQSSQAFKATAQIEDEGVRVVLLHVRDEEIQEERFSRARAAQNHRVGHVTVMKIQEVGCVVIGFKNGEIFLLEVPVLGLATVKRKEK
jgi:hypothetical protein